MNIVLTGFMGTGKTEVGKLLAKKLGWQYFDIDEIIEKETRLKISEIFARNGENYFRELETRTVKLVGLLYKAVISCGGGVVLRSVNMEELEINGVIVCLSAAPEKILERTKDNGDRPLLKTSDPLGKIKEMLKSRETFYKRCQLVVDTTELTQEEVVEKILNSAEIKEIIKNPT